MKLTEYLSKRGSKALTRIEAEIFGVPYPMASGWAHRHREADVGIDELHALRASLAPANSTSAKKALRGVEAAIGMAKAVVARAPRTAPVRLVQHVSVPAPRPSELPRFPGFLLRGAKPAHVGLLPWE